MNEASCIFSAYRDMKETFFSISKCLVEVCFEVLAHVHIIIIIMSFCANTDTHFIETEQTDSKYTQHSCTYGVAMK